MKDRVENMGAWSKLPQKDQYEAIYLDSRMLMRKLVDGEVAKEEFVEFLKESGCEDFLTSENYHLGGISPLAALRKQVELEKKLEEGEEKRGIVYEAHQAQSKKRKKLPYFARQVINDEDPLRRFVVLRSSSDSVQLVKTTRAVHLSGQEVISIKSLKKIIDACPDLQTVQIPPSLFRIVGKGIRSLLEGRSVKLREGRIRDAPIYDDYGQRVENIDEKRRLFKEMKKDPDKVEVYRLMQEHQFPEAQIAKLYFEDNKTLRQIAKEMEVDFRVISKKFTGLMRWIGCPVEDRGARHSISMTLRKIDKLKKDK